MIGGASANGDAAAQVLELGWFAAQKAVRSAKSECAVLLGVIEQAETDLLLARERLEAFETLCDALERDLHVLCGEKSEELPRPLHHAKMSAAS